jgi:hypothetical protein
LNDCFIIRSSLLRTFKEEFHSPRPSASSRRRDAFNREISWMNNKPVSTTAYAVSAPRTRMPAHFYTVSNRAPISPNGQQHSSSPRPRRTALATSITCSDSGVKSVEQSLSLLDMLVIVMHSLGICISVTQYSLLSLSPDRSVGLHVCVQEQLPETTPNGKCFAPRYVSGENERSHHGCESHFRRQKGGILIHN